MKQGGEVSPRPWCFYAIFIRHELELQLVPFASFDLIKEIKRTDLLLEWAVQHGDEAEAERLRSSGDTNGRFPASCSRPRL